MIKPGSPLLGIKNIPWLAVCFGFTLFMIILLLPLFLLHKEPIWDALSIGYPSFTYLADAIRGGRLPLWDPYTNCGLPFYADPNTFTLNPIAMFLGTTLQRSIHGFIAFWTFHWWLAGIGMIWLAKHFGARPLGGLFAAITFTLSGFFIGHAEHTTFIVVAGWVPWIILFADKAVLSSNKGWALLSGVCMGMTSYGGYHGLIPFTGLAVAIWLGLRFLSDRKKTMQVISTLIIIAVISIIAWSPLIYAFLTEGATYTDKVSALTSAGANYGNVFTVQALLSLFLPYATTVGLPPMYSDISMTNAYMGLFTIPFAVLWCWNEKNRRRFWSIFIFTVFMFIVSLGGKAGLRVILYYIFPPMRVMRFSAPFRLYWILAITLMAGLGFSNLEHYLNKKNLVRNVFFGWSMVVVAVITIWSFYLLAQGVKINDFILRFFLPGIVILPLFVLAMCQGTTKKLSARSLSVILLLIFCVDMAGHLSNNALTLWSNGRSALRADGSHQLETMIIGEPGSRSLGETAGFNEQQIAKKFIVRGYVNMTSTFEEGLRESKFIELLQKPFRFWISPSMEKISDQKQKGVALSTLSSKGKDEALPIFVEGVHESLPSAKKVVPGSYGETKVVSYAPERIVIDVNVPTNGGILVSTERFAGQWKGWIDEVPQKIIKTNFYFRGMLMPQGQHHVVWEYDPGRSWKMLVLLNYVTMLISMVVGMVLVFRN